MPTTRRRDRSATRAALLDAARRRFARHGLEGTGVRDIAGDVGVDAALVFRYFGTKAELYAEAMRVDLPTPTGWQHRPIPHIADELLHDVVFAEWRQFDGEHPLLVMLRSANREDVREQLRAQLCDGYLREFATRLETDGASDAALRAELIGALLLGIGVMRSAVGSPALVEAPFDTTRELVGQMVAALAVSAPA